MSWRMKTRTDPRHRHSGARWWLGATILATGAFAGAYLLDPLKGYDRRARLAKRLQVPGTAARNRAAAMAAKAESESEDWPEEAPPDVDSES
jgi:hypothetical protein